jgi:hypothetical protein
MQPWRLAKGNGEWTPLENLRSVMITSAVAPAPQLDSQTEGAETVTFVNNHHSSFSSYGILGGVAVLSWLVMLVCGAYGGWVDKSRRPVFASVTLFIVMQILLHLVYGEPTFLYSAHFAPALVLFSGFGWFSPYRKISVLAAMAFVVFGGIANVEQFHAAVRMVNDLVGAS